MTRETGLKFGNFLADLYLGRLDTAAFAASPYEEPGQKAREILERYREVIRQWPPEKLEEEKRVPPELLAAFGQIGLFGLTVPEPYGGLGLGLSQYLWIVEEMARIDLAPALVALAHLSIGLKGLLLYGNPEQKQKYLPAAASGAMVFAYALTEPETGSDARNIQTRADLSRDEAFYVLNGHKTYITNANYAGAFTVFAQLDPARPGFMGAFVVERGWEGVQVGRDMPKLGLAASSTAAVRFRNVRVPAGNLLGRPGDGFRIAMTILNYGRLALAAASAGVMKQAAADMSRRASTRKQFGVTIDHFELIQEKIVEASVQAFVTSAMVDFTASILRKEPTANVALESSHCKLFGTTRAWQALYDALQVAGGSGYISTQPYGKRMRDFRVTTVFEGTTEIHSIYPALFALRGLSEVFKKRGPLQGAFALAGLVLRRHRWGISLSDPTMRKALRLARANLRRVRLMLLAGLLRHGSRMPEKEFLLRRITLLSLHAFALLASLARIQADKEAGRPIEKSIRFLAYFLEAARESRRANARFFDSKKELAHKIAFQAIRSGNRPLS